MQATELIEKLKETLAKDISDFRIVTTEHGLKKNRAYRVWAEVSNKKLKDVVKKLFSLQEYPHFSVSSGVDTGQNIEILLHFTLNYAAPKEQVLLTLRVKLPKKRPVMETITDLIPGALISEKEKREFLGIEIKGLAPGRAFLDDSLAGVFPWRKDKKGANKIAKNLHTGERIEQK